MRILGLVGVEAGFVILDGLAAKIMGKAISKSARSECSLIIVSLQAKDKNPITRFSKKKSDNQSI